jgi:FlaA1/EpsC-like NDP-sugar epimerase
MFIKIKSVFKIMRSQFIHGVLLAFSYALVSILGLYSSYYIRFDGLIPDLYFRQLSGLVFWFSGIQLAGLLLFRQCNVVVSYFSLVDLRSILVANALSCLFLFASTAWMGSRIPRGVIILNFILLTSGVVLVRIMMRYLGEWNRGLLMKRSRLRGEALPVAIIGAGDSGARLVRELLAKPMLRLRPVAFFDDDPLKWGQRLHGVPIVGKPELIYENIYRQRFRKIIVAAPSATPGRLGAIARMAADLGISSDTLPAIDQLVDGTVKVSQLRPVRIDDLLRRAPIPLDHASIHEGLRGKVVAVTGAGGSIGGELCRQILRAGPRKLLLIERSEVQLFQIEQELLEFARGCNLVPLIADVGDSERIRDVFWRYRPDAIYHAAAHKHVPLMEAQPIEAIRNNSLGTANIVKIAHEFEVDRFVFISTDKAINPTNVMGASKRLAEIYLQAFQVAYPGPTRFMAVRFGNVLGSSGSVVPTFQKQIASGGPITVTHPDVTRYFMTIPEAVGLVLQAGALGKGGEIFVLDMGDPVKIVDLARQMIELSGFRPDEDIEITYVGLRPGEKMFEELSHQKEQLVQTGHPKILSFVSPPVPLGVVDEYFDKIRLRLNKNEPADLKKTILEMVPEYKPF